MECHKGFEGGSGDMIIFGLNHLEDQI